METQVIQRTSSSGGGAKMNGFVTKYDIIDEPTPFNVSLSAKYRRSFAYHTVQERLPIILTKIIDQTTRDREELAELYDGETTKEDVKEIIGNISQLKYELQTDKELLPFTGKEVDANTWNDFLTKLDSGKGSYFTAKWLYAECYMYRRLKSIFEHTKTLRDYDYFRKLKQAALTGSMDAIELVMKHVSEFNESYTADQHNLVEQFFYDTLRLNLWGNRCDLSISNGREVKQCGNPFEALSSYEPCILVDRSKQIWNCIKSGGPTSTIDFVLDNAGYELFTDCVLTDFLLTYQLAAKVRFHCKAIPWFISDVIKPDFHWTIETLAANTDENVRAFGLRLTEYVKDGRLELCDTEYYWTSPFEYQATLTVAPKVYEKLASAHLIIFKGDLNYRKLMGDINWPFDSEFTQVLGEFRPTNLCALRTVKADCICELENGKADELGKVDKLWMETGQFGVIQFAAKL